MPIYRDKTNGCYRFEFNRLIPGAGRVRARKRLPKSWTQAQADAFDRQESARLYALATGVERPAAAIDDAVALYLRERGPDLKVGKRIAQDLALIYWAYKGQPLDKLAEVCTKIRSKSGDLAPATIRNRIRYLTSACRYAWKHHGLCEHDPAARVIVPKVDNERQVYVDRRAVLTICRATQCRETRAFIRIAFYSGMRQAEIFRAEIVNGCFVLTDTKNGHPRTVPIHPRIAATVRGRLPFLAVPSTLVKRWMRARTAAGFPDVWFHSLRHSTASALINEGVDLTTIGAVLGHKSAQSTRRYSHLATDTLAIALAKIGRKAA